MPKKSNDNKNQTYDFDEILEKRNVTSPTPSNVSDDLLTTVASIRGDTGKVWCPECKKKGIDHEIKPKDDLNKHYKNNHSYYPLKRATLWRKNKKKENRDDDLNYMKLTDDFKKGCGKWDDISDEQIKDMIKESYENGMKMLDSLVDITRISSFVNKLKEDLKFYFSLHNSIENPDRDLLIHSLETLHLFGSKKQQIAGQRAIDKILLNAMENKILFDKLSGENKQNVLIKIMSGGKRRRKRKKTRKKRKRKSKKRKRKSRKRKSRKRRNNRR